MHVESSVLRKLNFNNVGHGTIVSTWTSVGTVHKVAYVKLFSANFYPLLLLHFVTHHGTPQSTSHISDPPPILVGLVQNLDKSTLYKFSLYCSRGFCPGGLSGVFCQEGFVRGGFCPFPLLSE